MKKQPTLKFNKKDHTYKVGKKKLLSVTKFVHSFFPPFDSKKMAKFVAMSRTRKGIKTTMRDVLKEWKAVSAEGTKTHNEIEAWIKTGDFDESKLTTKALHAIMWMTSGQVKDGELKPELKLFDEELKLAGTTDLCMQSQGVITLIDWKTNKAIKKDGYEKCTNPITKDIPNANYYQYELQLSTYAYMLERQGYKIGTLILVHLTNDGAVPYEVEYKKDTVMKMIEWRKNNDTKLHKK